MYMQLPGGSSLGLLACIYLLTVYARVHLPFSLSTLWLPGMHTCGKLRNRHSLNAILFHCNESMQYFNAKVGSALKMQSNTLLLIMV